MIPSVSWKEAIDTEEVIRDVLPNLHDEEVRAYIKEIGLVWEIYTVTYNEFTWEYSCPHSASCEAILRSKISSWLTTSSSRRN